MRFKLTFINSMKKHPVKFWITFWLISILLLAGWYFYWQVKNKGLETLNPIIAFLPISEQLKKELKATAFLADYALQNDNIERTYLLLYQNNLEIRPGGGYIGSFGIVKVKNGSATKVETHDLSNFDGRIPDIYEPPYPLKETLKIKSWKMRDSNFSPDFPTNAEKAEFFYHQGQGQENFDGVIGITANVLTTMLKITGPVEVEGYPGKFDSENAIVALEYQVEKGFEEQGVERGERKSIMNEIAKEIIKRISGMSFSQKIDVFKALMSDLNKKDIQMFFKEENIRNKVDRIGWGGKVDQNWKDDYLMLVDANLGALKSDYYVKRSVEYAVDLTGEKPKAILKITYNHTAKQKDFMTKDYLTYLRVYAPEGAWLDNSKNFDGVQFGSEFGKRYFGAIVKVPLGTEKTVELEYTLPKGVNDFYDLKIQKQAGINDVPVKISIIDKDKKISEYNFMLNADLILGETIK